MCHAVIVSQTSLHAIFEAPHSCAFLHNESISEKVRLEHLEHLPVHFIWAAVKGPGLKGLFLGIYVYYGIHTLHRGWFVSKNTVANVNGMR